MQGKLSKYLLPLLACLLGPLLPLPDLGVGLLLCASVPCTLSSAVLWTRLAGGNDPIGRWVGKHMDEPEYYWERGLSAHARPRRAK